MSVDEPADTALLSWLQKPWEAARRQGLPLCLIRLALDHGQDEPALRAAVERVFPSGTHGPEALGGGHYAVTVPATSPETAYRLAYRLHQRIDMRHRMGIAMANPGSAHGTLECLARHADDALARAHPEDCPVQGMDVIVS